MYLFIFCFLLVKDFAFLSKYSKKRAIIRIQRVNRRYLGHQWPGFTIIWTAKRGDYQMRKIRGFGLGRHEAACGRSVPTTNNQQRNSQ
jgi:hypothetical protein